MYKSIDVSAGPGAETPTRRVVAVTLSASAYLVDGEEAD
jgi:hypothetical protein